MKKIIILLFTLVSILTFSDPICRTDAFGYERCEYSDGTTSVSKTDSFGNTTTEYSNKDSSSEKKESSKTCHADPFGNVFCEYNDGRYYPGKKEPYDNNFHREPPQECHTDALGTETFQYTNTKPKPYKPQQCRTDSLGNTTCK